MKTLASICRVAFLTLAMSQLLSNCMTDDGSTNKPLPTAQPATGSTLASADPMATPGQPAGEAPASDNLGNPDYRIGPRDILQITVFQIQDLNTVAQVNEDGTVTLALVGKVPLSGRTTFEAEQTIGCAPSKICSIAASHCIGEAIRQKDHDKRRSQISEGSR